MDANRAQLRAWLKEVLDRTGETPTGLARKAGLAQSTLTRFMNNDDAPLLGLRSISKIAMAANTSPPGFALDHQIETAAGGGGFAEPEAVPLAQFLPNGDQRLDAIIELIKGKRKSADPWVLKSDVLKFAGYLPGDVVIVDLATVPAAGMIVCAQVYLWARGTAETIFRIYEPPYLVAATDAPHVRRPLLVDNNHVVIKGVVTESFRLTPP